MRLDLREVLATPGAAKHFSFQLDLSELEFYGEHPISAPVEAEGTVENHGGALSLKGLAKSQLSLHCDRCGKAFQREKQVPLDYLLSPTLEREEDDEILLLQEGALELSEPVETAFILGMDTKNLCQEDCKGLCSRCGADLNLGPCSCKAEIDPRMAALAQLLEE